MKSFFLSIIAILIFLLVLSITVLSTAGFETNKFNKVISSKITDTNKNIVLKLIKIKFKIDIKNFDLFLETQNPKFTYKDLEIPIKDLKVYFDFTSLILSKPKIDKINLSSGKININQLKKIVVKLKPSNINSLIVNKVQTGKLQINLELFFENDLILKNFIAKGIVEEMKIIVDKNLSLTKTRFDFFSDNSDILIKNLKSQIEGISIKDGNIQVTKNKGINLKSNFVTNIAINKENIKNFLPFIKKNKKIFKETTLKANLENFFDISFDETLKIINYDYSNKGKIKELSFKFDKPISSSFIEKDINFLYIKDSNFKSDYKKNKKININAKGKYSTDNKNYHNFTFNNEFLNKILNFNLDFEFAHKLNFDLINYKKDLNTIAKISINTEKKNDLINLKKLRYIENDNLILIEKLKLNKKNIISLNKIKVKTYENKLLNNDFSINYGKEIKVLGKKYDATNLNKFLNKNSKDNVLNKISKSIEIDLKNIETPLAKNLKNFRLIGIIKKGKFIKISSKGDFGNNKFLDISLKNDSKKNKKYLEIYSDLPQPLLTEYSFFKGLTQGTLFFSSIIEDNSSTSKLVIDNFKVVNAPGVVKLLSLADFGGLADVAEGDGLSFTKMEINMNNENGFLRLNELFAVGPSISVLMEGYKEENGLTSLKGTLVPAKNLNKLLSKIPVIGKVIIPSDVGEGLFGVSFKMKGMPNEIKTTINPLKTLTPRFITKALKKKD